MFVRAEVSGVRSSCEASATSRRCAPTELSSAASIALNCVASRPSSSSDRDRDALVQVAGRGDVLGRGGQPAHRPQRRRRDERGEPGGERDTDPADEEDPEADARERVVVGASGCDRDDRAAAGSRRDELAQRDSPGSWCS